jgi:hypothetical protein
MCSACVLLNLKTEAGLKCWPGFGLFFKAFLSFPRIIMSSSILWVHTKDDTIIPKKYAVHNCLQAQALVLNDKHYFFLAWLAT